MKTEAASLFVRVKLSGAEIISALLPVNDCSEDHNTEQS
jgi:hypothetical protein